MVVDGSKRPGIFGTIGIRPDDSLIPARVGIVQGIIGASYDRSKAPATFRVRRAIVDGSFDSDVVLELIRFLLERGAAFPHGIFETFRAALQLKNRVATSAITARELSIKAKKESVGRSFVFIGRIRKPMQVPPFWKGIVPEMALNLIQDPKKFIDEIEKEFLENSDIRELSQGIEGYKEMLYAGMKEASLGLQKVLPEKLYPAVIESLRKDYNEVLGERLKGSVLQKVMDESVEKVLKKSFESGFSAIYERLQSSANGLIKEMSDLAPPFMQGPLEAAGLASVSNNEFWIEVNCESESYYSVTIHGDDSAGRLDGVKLPLTYSHVPKKMIGTRFWAAFLHLSSCVERGEAIEYTVKDVVLTLNDLLQIKGKTIRPQMNCKSTFAMLESFSGRKIESALIADLFESKSREEIAALPILRSEKELTILPPFIQRLVEDLGPNASDIVYLKEVLSAVLGKDTTEALNELLEEIPKRISKQGPSKAEVTSSRKISENFHKNFISEIKGMRISLLHLYRLASRVSTFMAEWVSWTVILDCLVNLITFALPGLNLVLSVPVRYLCSLLLMYGVPVLARYLPPNWIEPVVKIFTIYHETLKAIERHITVMLLRFGSRMILSKEFLDDIKGKLLALQSEFTRGGELDFRVTRKSAPLNTQQSSSSPVISNTPPIPVAEIDEEDRVVRYLEITPITSENLVGILEEWNSIILSLKTPRQWGHFLNQQLRNLPIPGEPQSEIWDEIDNPDAVLEGLHNLLRWFFDSGLTIDEKIELVISLYTIYVAMDRVAKHPKTTFRIPKTYLANGRTFLLWQNSSGVRAIRARTRMKQRAISAYFKGDPDQIYKIEDSFPPALFEFTEQLSHAHLPKVDEQYLLRVPRAKLATALIGRLPDIASIIDPSKLESEKALYLFCECPELKPYYYLRQIHVIAYRALLCYHSSDDGANNIVGLPRFTWLKDEVYFPMQARFRRATGGLFTEHKIWTSEQLPNFRSAKFPFFTRGYQKRGLTQSELVVSMPQYIYEVERDLQFLIDMAELVPSDQIVRGISLIRQNPISLTKPAVAFHFQTFVLRPSLIKAAFDERNSLLREIGYAFLKLFEEVSKNEDIALFVAHVAGDFIALAADHDPEIRKHTPDFSAIIKENFSSNLSKFVIAGMYLDYLPENAPDSIKAEIEDLVLILDSIIDIYNLENVPKLLQDDFVRAKELIFSWKGYVLERRKKPRIPTPPISNGENQSALQSTVLDEWVLDPAIEGHHLHLLSWFQSLDDVKIICKGNFVKSIEFNTMKLIFDVREEGGKYSAYPRDPQLSSYALSKVQKDVRLSAFVNYLVLESEATLERRICIPVPDIKVIFGKHFMHEQKAFLSTFLEKVATASFFASKYYSYSFNEKGELTSEEPAAMAFLTLHYITRKDKKNALLSLSGLARIAHRKPFCKDTQEYIKCILFLEFSMNSRAPIFLKLVAILHKNTLLQSVAPIKEENLQIEMALWAMIQSVYSSYITEGKKFLTEYDELFILKYITAHCKIPAQLDPFKHCVRNLAMLPVCSLRYQLLRRIHGDQHSSWRYKAERALIHKLTDSDSCDFTVPSLPFLKSLPSLPFLEQSTTTSYMPKLLDAMDHPYLSTLFSDETTLFSDKTALLFVPNAMFYKVPLNRSALTPNSLHNRFIRYYFILYNKEEGHEKLAKTIQQFHGKFSDKSIGLLFFILKTLSKSSHPKLIFPHPSSLVCKTVQKRLIRLCTTKTVLRSILPKVGFSVLKSVTKSFALNKITSYIGSTVLKALPFYVSPLLRGIKMGHTTYKAVRLIQKVALPDLPKPAEKPSILKEAISGEAFAELSRREAEIDEQLTLQGGERIEWVANRPFQFVYPLTSDAAIAREFEKLNESITLYTELPQYSGVTHKFVGDKKTIFESLAMEESELESLIGLPFREILIHYVMGHKTKYDQKITLHLVSRSRWNAYFKRSSVKRAYKFNEISERHLRVFLVFEAKAETLIWQRQYGPLINLLNSADPRKVCEAIMGIGKTATLMPIKDVIDADCESIVINLRPSAIALSATEKSAEVSFELFEQITSVIPLTRSGWTVERLEALNLHIDEMIERRGIWDGTKEQFQALQLRFLEEGLDVLGSFEKEDKSSWLERLELFQKILFKLRKHANVNIDEAHIEFDRKTELNYPLGIAKPLAKEHAEILEEVMLALLDVLSLRSETPRRIKEEDYKRDILPLLARVLSRGNEAIERYFLNEAFYKESDERIDLIKGALNTLLPSILSEIVHVNYATLKEGSEEFAKPSDGNENPEVESTYKIQFSAFLKTAILFLSDRLNKTQLDKFIDSLKAKAKAELDRVPGHTLDMLNHTEAGNYFKTHSKGHDLFSFSPLEKDAIYENLNQSDFIVLDYCRIHVRDQIRYYNYSISNNAHNLASMFKSFSGYTASPYNAGTYPEGSVVLKDPGTQGETVSLLVERNSLCHTLLDDAPSKALDEICVRFFAKGSSFKAIIDRGAVFNGISNEIVARTLLRHIEKTDLKAVVFYNVKKEQMIWEKGRGAPMPFKESKIPPEDRLTYFDQSHTFAADIVQGIQTKAVVTVGESTLAEELFQAIWRMRGLKTKDQDIEFITTGYTKALIAGDDELTIEKIISFCLLNQGKESLEDNFASDIAALHNVIQRAVLDKAIEAKDVKKMIQIIRSFKSIFLNENTGNPTRFFGGIDVYATPAEVFENLRRHLYREAQASSLFRDRELLEISERLLRIGHNFYPQSVLKREKIDCSARQQVTVSQATAELEVEKEKMELKQEVKEHVKHEREKRESVLHKKWPSKLTYTERPEILTPSASHTIFSLANVLKGHVNHQIRPIAAEIDRRIILSNNLMPTPKIAFDEFQIPILEALLVFDEEGLFTQFILLSAEEAREQRKLLRKERSEMNLPTEIKAIVDINTKLIVAEGKIRVNKELLKSPELEQIFLQVKFLFGHTYYDAKEEAILTDYLLRADLSALKAFISPHHKSTSLQSSTLQNIIYKIRSIREPHTIFLRV